MKILSVLFLALCSLSAFARDKNGPLAERYNGRVLGEVEVQCRADVARKLRLVKKFALSKGSTFTGHYEANKNFEASRPLTDCVKDNALFIELADGRVCDVYVMIDNYIHPEEPDSAYGDCK